MADPETVAIPLSRAPVQESAGLFWGTLAFPSDPTKARKFADALWRERIRRTAIEDRVFAATPQPLPPRLLAMRDSEAEKLLAKGQKELARRRQAFFAEQAQFLGALAGVRFDGLIGFDMRLKNTAENRYVMTNIWLKKPAGASTKNLIRDVITPSRKVIHAACALWFRTAGLLRDKRAQTEEQAYQILLDDKKTFAALLSLTEDCRLAAIKAAIAREDELIRFVAD